MTTTGEDAGGSSRNLETHAKDIDRDSRKIIGSMKKGVGTAYYAYEFRQAGPTVNKQEIRIKVATLIQVENFVGNVEATATQFVRDQLTNFAVEIKNTTGAVRDAYRKVQEQASTPEALLIELRTNEKTATKDGDGEPLPVFDGHIYSDAAGKFPAKLNDWEIQVVTTEVARRSFVAWYRNPQRPTANSLRIPYQNESGKWLPSELIF